MSGRAPPSSRANSRQPARTSVQKAANRFRRFTGHDVDYVESVRVPDLPKAAAVIGECTAICYVTTRDGKEEHYIHEFSEHAAPMLCVSPDGKQIILVGGNFTFTERGIVDKKKNRR